MCLSSTCGAKGKNAGIGALNDSIHHFCGTSTVDLLLSGFLGDEI
jgi:hypothetical protein